MGYVKQTITGVSWVGGFRLSTRLITVARTAILARLLTPSQFGTFGIAALVLGLVEMLTETGINIFLIQEKDLNRYLNTAWVVSIVRGFIIGLVIILLAPLIVGFFNNSDAYAPILLISIVPILRGFINPAIVKFQKELRFDQEFWFRSSVFIVDSFVTILLAFFTRSATSFIWGFIAGAFVEVALSFFVVKPVPQFYFDFLNLRSIVSKGKWITATGIFHYLFNNLDAIVVGRLLGSAALGFYQMGYKIANLSVTEGADVVSRVTFPVYANISGDKKRLRKAFVKTTLALSLLVIPFGVLLVLFAEPLVRILLGDNWLEIVPILKVLSFFAIIRALSGSVGALFLGVKKQEYTTAVTLVSLLALGIVVVPLVQLFGIVGASMAALIGAIAALPVIYYYTRNVLR